VQAELIIEVCMMLTTKTGPWFSPNQTLYSDDGRLNSRDLKTSCGWGLRITYFLHPQVKLKEHSRFSITITCTTHSKTYLVFYVTFTKQKPKIVTTFGCFPRSKTRTCVVFYSSFHSYCFLCR